MSRTRAVATASEGSAAEAATALLVKGNAVDAVIAGVLAAAAASPSVLLGPVQILFGGAGLGLRAVDGRVRQPGKGAPRPRGFTPEQGVPGAARVGVSALPAALAAALASSGQSTLAQVMAPALAHASGERKAVLKRIVQRGPLAMLGEDIAGEIIAACGRAAGGLVTRDDLEAVLPAITPASELGLEGGGRKAVLVPWAEPGPGSPYVQVVAATDHKGLVAVGCYETPEDGVAIEPLGLVAPFAASPVLRGQTRVRPEVPVRSSAPIALVRAASEGAPSVALGIASSAEAESALRTVLDAWSNDAVALEPTYAGGGRLFGVMKTAYGATLLGRA